MSVVKGGLFDDGTSQVLQGSADSSAIRWKGKWELYDMIIGLM